MTNVLLNKVDSAFSCDDDTGSDSKLSFCLYCIRLGIFPKSAKYTHPQSHPNAMLSRQRYHRTTRTTIILIPWTKTTFLPHLPRRSILTPPPNRLAINIKNIRHRRTRHTNTSQNSQRIMHAQILIKRNPHNRHTTTRDIPDQRNRRQRTRSINLIAVNDILIAADENTQDTVAEEHGGR